MDARVCPYEHTMHTYMVREGPRRPRFKGGEMRKSSFEHESRITKHDARPWSFLLSGGWVVVARLGATASHASKRELLPEFSNAAMLHMVRYSVLM